MGLKSSMKKKTKKNEKKQQVNTVNIFHRSKSTVLMLEMYMVAAFVLSPSLFDFLHSEK